MNKTLKRVGILAAVFVVALLVFSKTLNHEPKDMTTDMETAGLPVIYMLHEGVRLSELHGYVEDMDVTTMGDNITVVPENNILNVQMDTYGTEVLEVSYEVRSGDGTRLIEDGQDIAFETEGDVATAQLPLQDLLSLASEYLLVLQVEQPDRQVNYYTKLIKYQGYDTDECIAFVAEVHAKTLDKQAANDLSLYLEPTSDADNTNLHEVTIHNRLRQIYWDKMEVTELTVPVITVVEANPDYNVLTLTTTVRGVDEEGSVDYYNVKEYYKVRQGIQRMYMLDYQRHAEEIFLGQTKDVSENSLKLGIRSADVDFWSNETGTNVCFVQQGELWSYNQSANHLACVFSFREGNELDVRENHDQHDIRIINADEAGSVDFIVYGYMNRGDHEGQVGISVCHYDSVTNTVEELLFLPTNMSYQTMKDTISQLLYINDDHHFYLMLNDAVYDIDLESKKYEVFLDNLVEGSCQVSADGRYIAWVTGNVNQAETMMIADLNTGKTTQVAAPAENYLKPLGFMEADCIYGYTPKAKQSDIFVATTVKVAEFTGEELVELTSYEKYGYGVVSVSIEGGTIRLQLVKNGETEVSEYDAITNKEVQESKKASVGTYTSDIKQTQVRLVLASENIPEKTPMIKEPKLLLPEKDTSLLLEEALHSLDAVQ